MEGQTWRSRLSLFFFHAYGLDNPFRMVINALKCMRACGNVQYHEISLLNFGTNWWKNPYEQV